MYDPAAGSGTLLLALAHQIGEDKCSIFSQDISQKSNEFLRLNLILNKQVHSLHHIIKGDTLLKPYHKSEDKNDLARFDYVVSNPPFKTDFSDDRVTLDQDRRYPGRFFAGVPNVPKKDKEKMAIYLLFIQHILYSLSVKGKAAIVVPTGFLTAKGIGEKIREELVNRRILRGVVSMPSDIFATTGTNVSILFIDKENTNGEVVLMDASKLGTEVKEGKNQKTVLSSEEEQAIINTFNKQETKEDFTVVVSFDKIKQRNYSFSAGQYFDVKIEYIDITPKDFEDKISKFKEKLEDLFKESKDLEKEIKKQIENLKYE